MKMIKKLTAVIMTIVMLFTVMPLTGIDFTKASALEASGQLTDTISYTFDESTGTLTISGTGDMPDYNRLDNKSPFYNSSIKNVIIEYGITNIGRHMFSLCYSLVNVTIPDSVTSIGDQAFVYCEALTNITIPDSVTNLGAQAFLDCISLKSITIPDSVTSIEPFAFYQCTALADISLSDNITRIGKSAFERTAYYNNSSNWEDNVLYIGNYLINTNESLSGIYSIKPGTKVIAGSAFAYCDVENVIIPDSVTNIDGAVFLSCINLENITIPDSVTGIGSAAFEYCKSLAYVIIGNGVTSIGQAAFKYCNSLAYAIIGNGVTSISDATFSNCDSLKSITISNSVTDIFSNAFCECDSLTDVYFNGTEEEWNAVKIAKYNNKSISNANIHCIDTPADYTAVYAAVDYANGLNPKNYTSESWANLTDAINAVVYDLDYTHQNEVDNTVAALKAAINSLEVHTHTWGEWIRTLDPTAGAEGVEERTCSVCGAVETRFVEKLNEIVDEETGVSIAYDDEFAEGVDVDVVEEFDGTSFQILSADYDGNIDFRMFDITPTLDGEKIQPDGTVTVRIPVPAEFNGTDIFVVYVNSENGTTEDLPCTVVNGYVEFRTTHFSHYAICQLINAVRKVKLSDLSLKPNSEKTLSPKITADDGVSYTVRYESYDPSIADVDRDGTVHALKNGKTAIRCVVTDEYGNTESAICDVTVRTPFIQWIIRIFFFGFLWMK